MAENNGTRREYLVTTGTIGMAALAGCSGQESNSEKTTTGNTTTENTDTDGTMEDNSDNDSTVRDYQQWLPAPNAFGLDHYGFEFVQYNTLQDNESYFTESVYDDYADRLLFDQLGVSLDDVRAALSMGPVAREDQNVVVDGDFIQAEVADHVTEIGYEQQGDIGEYTVYTAESNVHQTAFAITDGQVIFSNESRVDDIELIRGAKNGEQTRYVEESDTMQILLSSIESGTFVYGNTIDPILPENASPTNGAFTGSVGSAYQDSVNGETTNSKFIYLFDTTDDVDMEAIDEYINDGLYDIYESVSSTREGRKVIITGEVPTTHLYDF